MTFKTTRRRLLLAGTAAGATITMPWVAKAVPEFQFKYANNSPVAHPLNVRAREAMERISRRPTAASRSRSSPTTSSAPTPIC